MSSPRPKTVRPRTLSYYSYDSLGNPWLSGGGALRDFEILKRQAGDWDRITVWTGAYPGFKGGVREGVEYRGLGFGGSYLVSRLAFTLSANLRVLFDRADVIGNSLSAYAPLLAGLLRPDRFLIVVHHYIGAHARRKYSLVGTLAWLCEWLMLRGCKRIIVSNGKVAALANGMNPGRDVFQSGNGFDDGLLRMVPEAASPPFILYLGRFDIYMKGLDLLIAAYAGLDPAVRGSIGLVLAGAASPEALAAVGKLIPASLADRVRLSPNVSDAEKRELLRTCLFFASPSRFEGWGIAALEANAAGKAVLVSRADGFLDSIKEGFSGLMVPIEDGPALGAGLERLIGDAALRGELGRNAREWAARFTWDGIAARELAWIQRRA